MGWIEKIKEQAQEHTIKLCSGLLVLLLLVIWQALPPQVWERASAATPKPVLWALLGLAGIAILIEAAYIFELRRRLRLSPKFGVLWDKRSAPYCPSCSKPLGHYGYHQTDDDVYGRWGFWCIRCNRNVPMSDDEGNILELTEAKRLMSVNG